eukprot:4358432-Pyramimonas_sp.AAC.1
MRAIKAGRAPGPDGFPADLFKVAPRDIAKGLRPLFAKIAIAAREPIVFKLGEVTFFYKGSGPAQLAKAQRNITMASTVCKLYHRHVRALALQYLAQRLLAE